MSTAEKKNSNATGPIVALWAAILLVVFVAFRSTDLLRLPALLGNLGGGPLFGEAFLDTVIGALIGALILVAWFGLGSVITRLVPIERRAADSHVLEIARTIAVGSVLWSIVWFFLGIAGLYTSSVALIALLAGLALSALGFLRVRAAREESATPDRLSGMDKLVAAAVAFTLLIAFVAALAPPIAKDTLLYHFALPKAFIAQYSNAFVEGNIASYLALGGEMHFVWAMLLGGFYSVRAGEAAAGVAAFLFLPLLVAVIFGWARELKVSRRWSLAAVFLVASIPTVFHSASSGYTDIALSLYATLAAYSLLRWLEDRKSGHLIYLSIFLGGALSIKLTALFLMAAFGLVILLRIRKESENGLKLAGAGVLALVLAGVIASPWYLRTWSATGSPLFPFYLYVWNGSAPGWDVERSNLFQAMNAQYGGVDRSPINYVLAPVRVSLAAQPEIAELYDGVLGAAFLIGLPLLLISIRRKADPTILSMSAIAGVYFAFWIFSSEQIRYLLPIIPLVAIGIAAAGDPKEEAEVRNSHTWYYALCAAAVLCVGTAFAWFCMRSPLRVVLGGESRDAYLTRELDHYDEYRYLNTSTAEDAKVWLINMRRDTYNLDRPVISDYLFEDWTLRDLVWHSADINELRAKARKLGADYILARHDFLFDYDRSTIVDDKRPRAENLNKLQLAKDLLLDPKRTIAADQKFSLIKVGDQ